MAVFRDPRWVRRDLLGVLEFYYPTVVDTRVGGYVSGVSDVDGTVYDARSRHLTATCRFVFDFAVGALVDGPDWCRTAAEHGLGFLEHAFRDRGDSGGYVSLLDGREVADGRRSPYDHAFVLFAHATAARAAIGNADERIPEIAAFLDEHFWEPEQGAVRSALDADLEPIDDYRGQNANMHACEAYLAAYEATGDETYLDRATAIADTIARRLADRGDGLVWEHYTADWDHDWEHTRDHRDGETYPAGYQPGHQLEWAKLLVGLDRRDEADWCLPRAEALFDAAIERGWDDDHGGFFFSFDRDGAPIITEKKAWALGEGIGAAAALADATGDEQYWEWYDRIWRYVDGTVTNRTNVIWYEQVTRDGEPIGLDPTPKGKSGYHHVNACFETLRALGEV